mgnify:CR=1 FL=1
MNAFILYNSKHGTTKGYAESISHFLDENKVANKVAAIDNFNEEDINNADVVFLGSWTSGLFFFGQHPDKKWKDFVSSLPDMKDKQVNLFTTYKLLTGSMFRKMQESLQEKVNNHQFTFKSKSKKLTPEDINKLNQIISAKGL